MQPNSCTKNEKIYIPAIADPARRTIISLVMMQAMTSNALAEKFDSSHQAISGHIKILQECGLFKNRQTGRGIYYQVEIKKVKEAGKWLESFREM